MAITSTRDKLRLIIGDNDETNPLFQDDELDYFLTVSADNIRGAAIDACYAAAAKYARAYDFETDGQRFQRSAVHKAWLDMAKTLQAQGPTVTGLSVIDVTKVDGYSDDVANQDVDETNTNARHGYYRVGVADLP